jgi:hypothetical protein
MEIRAIIFIAATFICSNGFSQSRESTDTIKITDPITASERIFLDSRSVYRSGYDRKVTELKSGIQIPILNLSSSDYRLLAFAFVEKDAGLTKEQLGLLLGGGFTFKRSPELEFILNYYMQDSLKFDSTLILKVPMYEYYQPTEVQNEFCFPTVDTLNKLLIKLVDDMPNIPASQNGIILFYKKSMTAVNIEAPKNNNLLVTKHAVFLTKEGKRKCVFADDACLNFDRLLRHPSVYCAFQDGKKVVVLQNHTALLYKSVYVIDMETSILSYVADITVCENGIPILKKGGMLSYKDDTGKMKTVKLY